MDELDKYSKSNPFKVPDNYFDDFEKKLINNINQQDEQQENVWKLKSIKPFLAVAAGFALIFSLWFMFLNKIDLKSTTSNNENNDQEQIFNYFESVSSDELIRMITSEDLQQQDIVLGNEKDVDIIIDEVDESIIIDETLTNEFNNEI